MAERQQRLLLAAEARSLGHGGISRVARVTGVSRPTIHRGLQELDAETEDVSRIRQPGGGRKLIEEVHPSILEALDIWLPRTRVATQNRRCRGHVKAPDNYQLL